jgi:Hypoxanthine-guanine phosphoribosyltransferase
LSDALAAEAWAVYRTAECLYDEATVRGAVDRLAGEVTAALAGRNPLLLCPMTGGVVLAGHLLPQLDFRWSSTTSTPRVTPVRSAAAN